MSPAVRLSWEYFGKKAYVGVTFEVPTDAAAMSSTASELNALASTTAIDLYKRNVGVKTDSHMVKTTKWFTLGWGILAILIACFANLFDNLIQLVNTIGSLFYGNVLGIFLLAFFYKKVNSRSVFSAAIITQILILLLYYFGIFKLELAGEKPIVSYLWLNFIGTVLVIYLSLVFIIKKLDIRSKVLLLLISANIFKLIYDVITYSDTNMLYILSLIGLFIVSGLINGRKNK